MWLIPSHSEQNCLSPNERKDNETFTSWWETVVKPSKCREDLSVRIGLFHWYGPEPFIQTPLCHLFNQSAY